MERHQVRVTWWQDSQQAAVTTETYGEDGRLLQRRVTQTARDDPLVLRAVAEWQEGTLRLFDS